ncbi:putative transmembrane protein [Toxoplasma gondii p89]|uniref:Putative transmembrane protein n=1 Tax=Toxoplasma gondii p89 TaxID=943119 RepID=A0A086KBY0_TOXGO|nr:putative transmembrane protein [Toxoplasma gondii p89]
MPLYVEEPRPPALVVTHRPLSPLSLTIQLGHGVRTDFDNRARRVREETMWRALLWLALDLNFLQSCGEVSFCFVADRDRPHSADIHFTPLVHCSSFCFVYAFLVGCWQRYRKITSNAPF